MSIFALLSAVVILHQLSVGFCWMDAPYGNNNFNSHEQYGHNATLECSDDRTSEDSEFQYWILPDLTVMNKSSYQHYWTLYGVATWRVSDNGMTLHATNINERQFGFYYCLVKSDGKIQVVKKAINYTGPYFGNLWPKYRMNVIIGLSAAGIFVVLAILFVIIVASCNKKTSETDGSKRNSLDGVVTSSSARTEAPTGEFYGLKRRDVVSVAGYDGISGDKFEEIRL